MFWLLLALYFSAAATKLGLGAGGRPGAGFFPFGAACVMAIITLFRALKSRHEKPATILATSGSEWRKIACILTGMTVYAYLLQPLGFLLCTFSLMLFYLKIIALQRWPISLAFAFTVALLSHLFFDTLLNAQMPRGILAALM